MKKEFGIALIVLGIICLIPAINITGNVAGSGVGDIASKAINSILGLVLIIGGLVVLGASERIKEDITGFSELESLVSKIPRNRKEEEKRAKEIKRLVNEKLRLSPDTDYGKPYEKHLPGGESSSVYDEEYSIKDIHTFEKRAIAQGRGVIQGDTMVFYGLSDRGPTGQVEGEDVRAIKVTVEKGKQDQRLHYHGQPISSRDIPSSVRGSGLGLAELYNSLVIAGYKLPEGIQGKTTLEKFQNSKFNTKSPGTMQNLYRDNNGYAWADHPDSLLLTEPPHFDVITGKNYDIVSKDTGKVLRTKPSSVDLNDL